MFVESTRKTKEQFYQELITRFPKNHVEILEYTKASGPIKYKCLDCGRIYQKNRANHLYENKTLCQKCFSSRSSALRDSFLASLKEDFEILEDNYEGKALTQKFHIRCKKCGKDYYHKVQMADVREKFVCTRCETGKVDLERLQKRFEEKGLDKEFQILEYKGINYSLTVRHKCGYIFSRLPGNLLGRARGCPKCSSKKSSGERRIANFLEKNKIVFEEQKRFKELGALSYDFYLPSENLLIEYQGEQHYEPVKYFGGDERFEEQKDRDRRKREYAKKNGYRLLEICYKDFDSIETILEGSTTISEESKSNSFEGESIL